MSDPLIEIVANIQENTIKHTIDLVEKALWGMQNCNYIKTKTDKESPYQHGFRVGYNQAKKLGIGLIEKVIEELKRE